MALSAEEIEFHTREAVKAHALYDGLIAAAADVNATGHCMLILVGAVLDDLVSEGAPGGLEAVLASVRVAATEAGKARLLEGLPG